MSTQTILLIFSKMGDAPHGLPNPCSFICFMYQILLTVVFCSTLELITVRFGLNVPLIYSKHSNAVSSLLIMGTIQRVLIIC